jgi:hypothetical protein
MPLDYAIIAVYLFEYALRLFSAPHPFHFLITVQSLVDLCTIYPIVYIKDINGPTVSSLEYQVGEDVKFWYVSKVLRLLRVVRFLSNNYKAADSEFSNVNK